MSQPLLSLLVCSLEKRDHFLKRLKSILDPQMKDNVELLVEIDNGEMTIGAKRNKLVNRASGSYIAFIDDDDRVSGDYLQKNLEALSSGPECLGMEGEITFDGRNPKIFIHSMKHDSWFEKDGKYYRPPNHLNIVKREIALQVPFKEINHGEDSDYSMRIRLLLNKDKEVYVPGPTYFYDFRTHK